MNEIKIGAIVKFKQYEDTIGIPHSVYKIKSVWHQELEIVELELVEQAKGFNDRNITHTCIYNLIEIENYNPVEKYEQLSLF